MDLLRRLLVPLAILLCSLPEVTAQTCANDQDCDGIPDALDECPERYGVIGSPCNDGQLCTTNDVISAGCVCAGTAVVCADDGNPCTTVTCISPVGCVQQNTGVSMACNDGNACTINDVYNAGCVCTGTALPDSDGDGICNVNDNCPNITGVIGSPCNDGQVCTTNDVINASCVCAGTAVVCGDDGNPCTTATCLSPQGCVQQNTGGGTACNDGNACTINDVYSAGCICTGTALPDGDGDGICNVNDNCPNITGVIGSPCNDGQVCTTNDVINASCVCAGTAVVCANDNNPCTTATCISPLGCVQQNTGGGTACNDGNACTINDVYSAGCICTGTALPDSDGDGICNVNDNCPNITGVIGSTCNDGQVCTTNDVINASCQCAGTAVVCADDGNPCTTAMCISPVGCVLQNTGGGTVCNDGNACTINDVYSAGCVCTGTALPDGDGDGICNVNDNCPNITGVIGSPCNDGQVCTTNDVINASCVCTGTAVVCADDGNPCTTATCLTSVGCVQQLTGGGTACDDGDPCTINDVFNAGCVCVGTATPDSDGDGLCNAVDPCPNNATPVGAACNDNLSYTYNDVFTATCTCTGTLGRIAVKVFLEGPYGGGTMIDVLRANGLLPLNEPYTGLGYAYTGGASYATTAAVRNVSGASAIVDWVVLELRSRTTPTLVVHSRAALVQRDGDVVDVDGVTAPAFPLAAGPYLLAVRHRNHLPVMVDLNAPVDLGTGTVTVDLTLPATATYGVDARKNIGGTMVLWAGNTNFDSGIKYTGTGNDRDPVLTAVGSTTPNNAVPNAYSLRDVNLDGLVKYTGSGNDRDPILISVGSTTPNNVRVQQLP